MKNYVVKHEKHKGWLVILTKGLTVDNVEKFRKLIGNPFECKWMCFPSEYVKKIEYIRTFGLKSWVKMITIKIRWLICQKKKEKKQEKD